MSKVVALFGVGLASSAALPWTSDGTTFVDLVIEAYGRSVLEAMLLVLGFGSPFLFGLASAIGILFIAPAIARRVVRFPIAFMHSQMLLVAIMVMTARDEFVAAVALLGFAIASGLRFAMHTARTRAEGAGPSFAWYVRWGAVIVVGMGGWLELQRVGGLELGLGLHVALASAVLVLVSLGPSRSFRAAAPMG